MVVRIENWDIENKKIQIGYNYEQQKPTTTLGIDFVSR